MADSTLRLLDVFTGFPGSVHDARVFGSSPLHNWLTNQQLPQTYHLLGDSAYPLSSYLLVPYRDNGHLTTEQTRYNKIHASTRVDVERAIGLLKGKWRRLKHLDMVLMNEMLDVIVAACVLHNFVIESNGTADLTDLDLDLSDDDDAGDDQQGPNNNNNYAASRNAEAKRHDIACQFV